MEIVSMEKLPNGTIRVGLGANKDAKTELFVDLYSYNCTRIDSENGHINGSFIDIHDVKNKNRMMFHYRSDYDIWSGGSLAFMAGNGAEYEVKYDDPEYRTLSTVFAAIDPKRPAVLICQDPESIFNNYPGEKVQHRRVDTQKQVNAIDKLINNLRINNLSQKTRE